MLLGWVQRSWRLSKEFQLEKKADHLTEGEPHGHDNFLGIKPHPRFPQEASIPQKGSVKEACEMIRLPKTAQQFPRLPFASCMQILRWSP